MNLEPEHKASRGTSFHFLVELFNYLCRISSVACAGLPSIFEDCTEVTGPAGIHQLTGMAGCLYQVLPSISRLAERCRTFSTSEVPEDLRNQALELEMKLQSWMPDDVQLPGRYATEARAATFATRWAILMRLNQVTRRMENDEAQITKAADNILSALSLIRPGSETEARILFPLFMAGVGSMTKANRLTVEYRLSIMETTVGFGNIAVAHRLLQELWRRANNGQVMDWEVLQRTKYPGLVLL
jgi:transcriptional activator protein UGA3